MTKYLAGVLSVIAVGVLLIAYGLLAPGASASFNGFDPYRQPVAFQQPQQAYPYGAVAPMAASPYVTMPAYQQQVPYATPYVTTAAPLQYATPVSMQVAQPAPVQTVTRPVAPRRTQQVRYVERAPKRDWKKTALVIGGSTAAGAGLGGIFGGKKGALIGAAVGGGASTLYEATKK
jgi:uncharacterized protein YcfJ